MNSRVRIALLLTVGILAALLIVLIGRLRTVKLNRRLHASMLRQVLVGLRNYAEIEGRFPPAGTAAPCSWRFVTLAYIEGMGDAPFDFESPWDDPANGVFANCASPYYCWTLRKDGSLTTDTNVIAVAGTDTYFDLERLPFPHEFEWDAIVLLEAFDTRIHWMEPSDSCIPNQREGTSREFSVAFLDGEVWVMHASTPHADIAKFFTIDSAKQYDRDIILAPYVIEKHGVGQKVWSRVRVWPTEASSAAQ